MNKSEVERHKMYEHPVPVSPFEDKLTTTTTTTATKNSDSGISSESLHKLTTDVEAAAGIGNNAAKNGSTSSPIVGGRRVSFKPFKL
jgi:hypothetical protein